MIPPMPRPAHCSTCDHFLLKLVCLAKLCVPEGPRRGSQGTQEQCYRADHGPVREVAAWAAALGYRPCLGPAGLGLTQPKGTAAPPQSGCWRVSLSLPGHTA